MIDQQTDQPTAETEPSTDQPLLKVTDLQRYFPFREVQGLKMVKATVKAVDGISFTIREARPSASSASPAVASRRRHGSSPASTLPPPARSSSRAATSRTSRRRTSGRSVATSR